ncbi:bifunctional hydroxymethylpyrimidine kinase/phosphomethylpyrimidine kinase [bacterium]|nr:bifunctional hydroxymethylpyrimidine kinase/phosphomethylpyrimidine kinase [bacterium]
MGNPATLLILSGFDPTTGAGLTRDVLTARDCGVYPLSVPTTLTIQNSARFLSATPVATSYLEKSVALLFEEFSPKICKIGLIPTESEEYINSVAQIINSYKLTAVIDPIIKPTMASDRSEISSKYLTLLRNSIVTPNRKETDLLLKHLRADIPDDDAACALKLSTLLNAVVVLTNGKKGVTLCNLNGEITHFPVKNLGLTREVHGTGCTFSTAIASFLAKDFSLTDAVKEAVDYVDGLLEGRIVWGGSSQDYL